MKSFIAGIAVGALLTAVLFGFSTANYAGAQARNGGVKFAGIANSTDKSNTRAITESGDIYELKQRTVRVEGGKDGETKRVYYWDKEINVLEDQAEYLKLKPE